MSCRCLGYGSALSYDCIAYRKHTSRSGTTDSIRKIKRRKTRKKYIESRTRGMARIFKVKNMVRITNFDPKRMHSDSVVVSTQSTKPNIFGSIRGLHNFFCFALFVGFVASIAPCPWNCPPSSVQSSIAPLALGTALPPQCNRPLRRARRVRALPKPSRRNEHVRFKSSASLMAVGSIVASVARLR